MSQGHALYHYATRNDYESVIVDVAAQLSVKYVDEDSRVDPNFPVYSTPLDAEGFGISGSPEYPDIWFLVLPEKAEIPWEYWPNRKSLDPAAAPQKYLLYPLRDPNYRCIMFRPSGLHKSEQWGEGLHQGILATNSQHPDSLAIFTAFKKSIKKRFEYIRPQGVYVGPEALKYMEAGGRLNQNLKNPRVGDVKHVLPAPTATLR